MSVLNILSFTLFIIFLSSYSLKLVVLYKNNKINANVLGKGKKDKKIEFVETAVKISSFTWGITWILEIFASKSINKSLYILFSSILVNYLGILSTSVGVGIFVTAMISMKTSWRVGIDKNTKTKLVTYGVYNHSRNPAFVGFYLMFIGLFLTYPNILTALILIVNIVSIHRLVLQEEIHLETLFGMEYISYKDKTPRYL
ncbi:isoprenylcysteine carboxylmethyltransferase family protein [Clostridium estertheticum]|uniref:methyltransferase family protein n=1 Tax=Clostridium estertheticum TaxID=238834 RepID=UPI001C7DAEE2|nr:isoprenylcysteine carboxylmethyltransferase family protein [Clostridium estertheticum]MBX4260826.1 isoprenylcysteine carboxylmethyltransferase family protein [Clostridium estertheticum]WLC71509.1 isoprenylcysteine carboxylmethyltransferase family protein [Clostridium estertheticum]